MALRAIYSLAAMVVLGLALVGSYARGFATDQSFPQEPSSKFKPRAVEPTVANSRNVVLMPNKPRYRILVTGFGPFEGMENRSEQLAQMMGGEHNRALWFVHSPLPVQYERAAKVALVSAQTYDASVVVILGIDPAAMTLNVISRANNEVFSGVADNAGMNRQGQQIIGEAPELLSTTMPIEPFIHSLLIDNISAVDSDYAGGYVCNDVFFRTLWNAREQKVSAVRNAILVHIPRFTQATPALAMALSRAVIRSLESQ